MPNKDHTFVLVFLNVSPKENHYLSLFPIFPIKIKSIVWNSLSACFDYSRKFMFPMANNFREQFQFLFSTSNELAERMH